jgi:EAL domain-containing protein (putative c-di-GMP-specific phosphodiesterase class I)
LCDAQGLDVIAEGIESSAQAEKVVAAGCRFAQGHLFGRPMPIAEVSWSSSYDAPLRRA